MALRFIEGFDDGLMTQHGWTNSSHIGTGRLGGGAWYCYATQHQGLNLAQPISGTVIVGFAFRHNNTNTDDIFAISSLHLQRNASGSLSLLNNSTVLATTPNTPLSIGVWRYIEVKYTTATGAVVVRIDGSIALTGTVGVIASVSSLTWANSNNFSNDWCAVDDVYILDATGTTNNNFLGDVRVQTLLPTADGANSGLTPSTGTTHAALVSEAAPNTTDYVYSATAGVEDTYQFQDLAATTANIFGVEITNYSRKDATGSVGVANVSRVAGVDYTAASQGLSTSWAANRDLLELNPATGLPWAPADINNSEFGVKTS